MSKKPKRQIADYIKNYTQANVEIKNSSDIFNEEGFDSWSFKKLIILEYYIKGYLNTLKKNGYKCFFIDMFSGSGASMISDKISTIGSPIISILSGVFPIKINEIRRFDKWFFLEKEDNYCNALEKRIDSTISIINKEKKLNLSRDKEIFVYRGDCNENVDRVVSQIKQNYEGPKIATLTFVDPYNLGQFRLKSLEKISKLGHADIIFTIPTSDFKRNIKTYKNIKELIPITESELDAVRKEKSKITDEDLVLMFAKNISHSTETAIRYSPNGVIAKNRKESEIYRTVLFSKSKAAPSILGNLFVELNKLTTNDIDGLLKKIHGSQSDLKGFLSSERV